MRRKPSRILAFALAVVIAISLMGIFVSANFGTRDFEVVLSQSTFVFSESTQTVTVNVNATSAFTFDGFEYQLSSDLSGVTFDYSDVLIGTDGGNKFKDGNFYNNGHVGWSTYDSENITTAGMGEWIMTIPANAAVGNYVVELTEVETTVDCGDDGFHQSGTVIASFSITDTAAVTPAYELYYTLDKSADTDTDNYIEYEAGDFVTATFYVKSNVAINLQAFDLYVMNDEKLEYQSYTTPGDVGSRITSGAAGQASTATLQRIKVYSGSDHPDVSIPLTADTGVEIATITFLVKDTAVYDTGMPITISDQSVIAVANNAGDIFPDRQTVSSTILGVETLEKYQVTYDANLPAFAATQGLSVTGMPNPLNAEKQYNVDLTVATAPSLTHYTFAGWNTAADGSGDPYAASGTYSANADATLYAQWTPETFTVTFKDEDGSTLQTGSIAYGEVPVYDATTNGEPSKAADAQYTYTWTGWNDGTNDYSKTDTLPAVTGAVTYTPTFSAELNSYTIVWKNWDGSTLATQNNVPYGETPSYPNPTDPERAATAQYTYTFSGWSPLITDVEGDAEYTAQFTEAVNKYDVTFNIKGHGTQPDNYVVGELGQLDYGASVANPGNLSETGWTFGGWFKNEDCTTAFDFTTETVTGTTVIYAKWTEKTYTIHFDGNNNDEGTVPPDMTSIAYTNESVVIPAMSLIRHGFTAQGWNTAADGSGTDISGTKTMAYLETFAVDGVVTLYAKWGTEAYTIVYDYDGGALPSGQTNPTGYNVGDLPITLNVPEKQGYSFNGWTIAVVTGEEGAVEVEGNVINTGSYGNLAVTALWTPRTDTGYRVIHRFQSLDDLTAYVEDTSLVPADDELTGTTGAQTVAAAKTITGYTAKEVTQAPIAADGSTVVEIRYDRNTYYVTYAYTNDPVPSDATDISDIASTGYLFGAPVTIDARPISAAKYDFSGWKINGSDAASFTMGAADVAITGTFTEHSYTIKFWTLVSGETGNTVLYEKTYTLSTQGGIVVPTVPAKTWYESDGWTSYTLFSAEEINVYPQYTKITYHITFLDEDGNELPDQGTDNAFDIDDKTIVPPTVPAKDGYDAAWPEFPTGTASDASVQPVYTHIKYTITFVNEGGDPVASMEYYIDSEDKTLPEATGRVFYRFVNWKVTTAGGNWAENSTADKGSSVEGRYGNVTLTAQWEISVVHSVDIYKFAPDGYKLLRIDATAEDAGKTYTITVDGVAAPLYYIEDATYALATDHGVFYTLIPSAYYTGSSLNDAGVAALTYAAGERQTISYNGDVNQDGRINIADANAVYQMVKNGGNYYPSLEEISIVGRLVADMSKDNDAGEAEYRGSINDVEAVSDAIDGTAISHSASADVDQPEGSFSVIDRVIARRLDLDLLALLPVRRVFLTI